MGLAISHHNRHDFMYLRENPVLQRELLVNLRMNRAFALLLAYVVLLSGAVLIAWPSAQRMDMSSNPENGKTLVNLIFLEQYLLAALMAPSFAAGAITGEKERKSYEMLLASPLRPGAIVLGKLLASLTHLAILIFCSLPIVMLCLPLGGVSLYEVLAVYLSVILSTITFGMMSLAASSYFRRTSSSLVVSYLLVLPLALAALYSWYAMAGQPKFRLLACVTVLPALTVLICTPLFVATSRRLLHPPDVGSDGQEVIDEYFEQRQAVGLIIQRDKFPDRLFAPPKRDDLLADGANPIFDKEMRSEIFSQGTLMARVVIQVSMALAVPMMSAFLFLWPDQAPWYVSYVILFNMLVGPVFSAGSVTSERERETLDLLLVTLLSPWQILWGKLISALRVSTVLTCFLLWPLVLACALVPTYWTNWRTLLGYLVVVLLTSVTTSTLALFCSVLFRKTSVAMMISYLVMAALFLSPIAIIEFGRSFFSVGSQWLNFVAALSPFGATFNLPLDHRVLGERARVGDWSIWFGFVGFDIVLVGTLVATMLWLFKVRWRVAT